MSLEQLVSGAGACAPDEAGAPGSSAAHAAQNNPLAQFANAMLGGNPRSQVALNHARFGHPAHQHHQPHAPPAGLHNPGMVGPRPLLLDQRELELLGMNGTGPHTESEQQFLMEQRLREEQAWAHEFAQQGVPQRLPRPAAGLNPAEFEQFQREEHMRQMQFAAHQHRMHHPPPAAFADEFLASQQQYFHQPLQPRQPAALANAPALTSESHRELEAAFASAASEKSAGAQVSRPSLDSAVASAAVGVPLDTAVGVSGAKGERAELRGSIELDSIRAAAAERAREHFGTDATAELIQQQVDEFIEAFKEEEKSLASGAPQETDWARDFASLRVGDGDEQQWGTEFEAAEKAREEDSWAKEFESGHQSWGDEFTSLEGGEFVDSFDEELRAYLGKDPNETDYEFAENNPYVGDPQALQLAEKFLQTGDLIQAVLALEAVVQADASNARAWVMLGATQAECDADGLAIAALRRCVETSISLRTPGASSSATAGPMGDSASHAAAAKRLPATEHVLQGLLLLAVSYTNELDSSRALDFLRRWVDAHPQFSNVASVSVDISVGPDPHEALVSRLMAVARAHPRDADVQLALGVLHNLSRSYDLAAAAFREALRLRPNDYQLWNKLGATCANGGEAREALAAYRRAVELKPQYVRAWVNVGTSYANQTQYEQAMRYYVKALRMNPDMKHVWSYLRTTVIAMRREDLLGPIQDANLEALAKEFP